MNIAELLGQNIFPEFVRACERAQGWADYPSFDPAYYHSEAYTDGYKARYHFDINAKEAREDERREFPRSAEIDRRNGL